MMVNDVRAQEFTQVVFFTITCNTYEKIISRTSRKRTTKGKCSFTGGVRLPEGEKNALEGTYI